MTESIQVKWLSVSKKRLDFKSLMFIERKFSIFSSPDLADLNRLLSLKASLLSWEEIILFEFRHKNLSSILKSTQLSISVFKVFTTPLKFLNFCSILLTLVSSLSSSTVDPDL